jgi:hypothetical protein
LNVVRVSRNTFAWEERFVAVIRLAFILLVLVFAGGCSQTVRTARVADAYEVEVHDDGATAMLNSSILHHDWDEAAKKVCPAGYAIVRQEYFKEEPFKPARIVGTITCK